MAITGNFTVYNENFVATHTSLIIITKDIMFEQEFNSCLKIIL